MKRLDEFSGTAWYQFWRRRCAGLSARVALLLIFSARAIHAQSSTAATDAGSPVPLTVGPHSRTWNVRGSPVVELATGMNFWDGQAWSPSDPSFRNTSDAFVAERVQHKLRLSSDLNVVGAVAVKTPDGQLVSSTPVGIGIFDPVSGQFLLVGTITNTVGVMIANNQILYEDAFVGTCASVLYTLDRGSFEQDIIFTGKLDPTEYGFPKADIPRLRIQIITELYQPPSPDVITRPISIESSAAVRQLMVSPDLMDETIGFGEYVLGLGRAYTTPTLAATNGAAAPVAKELVQTEDGRIVLVESVEFASLQEGLLSLPDCQQIPGSGGWGLVPNLKQGYASLPNPPRARAPKLALKPVPKRLANAPRKPEGVVIDYVATIGGTLTSTVLFASDTNYFVSGNVFCNGATIIEPTVVKYNANTYLQLNNTLTTKTSMYRPAIFTAEDDNTVGDSLVGFTNYTGVINPAGYANPAIYMNQTSLSLTGFRFCYAQKAIRYNSPSAGTAASLSVSHSQFVNCIRGIEIDFAGTGTGTGAIAVNLNNSLLAGVEYPVYVNAVGNPVTLNLANCTVDQATKLVGGSANYSVLANFTNSVFANVTNSSSGVTLNGNYNGFYSAPQQFGANTFVVNNSPFQPTGAGYYYITDASGFRNAGTTVNLSPTLQSDLQKRTTYPPTVISQVILTNSQTFSPQAQRDTDAIDLGFHYDPLDYALGWVLVTNATITVTNGAAIGTFGAGGGTYGLAIGQSATLISQGRPNAPNWVAQYNAVQEQPITNWYRTSAGALASEFQGLSPGSTNNCRFTQFAMPSLDAPIFNAFTNIGPINFQDCEFHGGKLITTRPTVNLTNCLLERVYTDLEPKDTQTCYVRNCLVLGQSFIFGPTNSVVRDNLFDTPTISNWNGYTGGTNAYITNYSRLQPTSGGDILLSASPSYQAGPLGTYYLPNNSSLINAETHISANQVGLYQYTVCTNLSGGYQIKETNSWVDVTYHYVATDSSGNPQDGDLDGVPDYLEDTNGDGVFGTGDLSDWLHYNSPGGLTPATGLQVFTPLK